MTRLPMFLALALAAGCTAPDELHMEMMSSMQSETRGVVLYPDGQRGHAAMNGTTCEFDTLNGWLISDHDLPTEAEEIQDQFEGIVLGRSAEGAHLVQDREHDVEASGVVHTRIMEDGSVAMIRQADDGSCLADFEDGVVEVPKPVCKETTGFTTDRRGNLFAATGNGLYRMSGDGSDDLGGTGDLAVWDDVADMLYVSSVGSKFVTGVRKDGSQAWEVLLDGYVNSLDDMGRRGNALVMIDLPDGGGELVIIEGHSGEIITEHSTPTGDGDVTTSDDGRTLAVTLTRDVYFYDVTADGETKKARRTLGSPDPTFMD